MDKRLSEKDFMNFISSTVKEQSATLETPFRFFLSKGRTINGRQIPNNSECMAFTVPSGKIFLKWSNGLNQSGLTRWK